MVKFLARFYIISFLHDYFEAIRRQCTQYLKPTGASDGSKDAKFIFFTNGYAERFLSVLNIVQPIYLQTIAVIFAT